MKSLLFIPLKTLYQDFVAIEKNSSIEKETKDAKIFHYEVLQENIVNTHFYNFEQTIA